MTYIERARIYRARYERLNAIPNKSERLQAITDKILMLGLFYCFNEMLEKKLYQ